MSGKKLLIASSHPSEAITKWILETNSVCSSVDLIFIDGLLKEYDIHDELSQTEATIRWQREGSITYSNKTHCLLNRIIHIDDRLFSSFRDEDKDYAKRELEAYLGFSLNAFQSPQNQAINGMCERVLSLPQQWQLVADKTGMHVPEYYWGSKYFNSLSHRDEVIHSHIFDFLNWSVTTDRLSMGTGFSFIKPRGIPIFVLSIGTQFLLTNEQLLTHGQRQVIIEMTEAIRCLFGYFIFELLVFISDNQITFGCVNIDVIRSAKNAAFHSFLERILFKEYYKCLN